ncbi:MAG: metallophosphoesterase [Clostridia bacterium]|nr:metallophosphoesterase [Clostridia bacterium]
MDISTVMEFIKQVMATLMILLTMMSPAFGGNGTAYEAEKPEELVTSFAVISDIHVETNNPESYKNLYDVLEGIKAGKNVDTVVYTGDNVMNGQLLENIFFYSAVRAVKPAENNLVLVGNHDLGNGARDHENSAKDFIANNNLYLGKKLENIYYYDVIDGCYMICLATEHGDPDGLKMSDEQLEWLEGVLTEAQQADAPVIVFCHYPIRMILDRDANEFAALLKKYDVDLYVHGHIHDDLGKDNFYNWGGINCINLPRITETTNYVAGDGIVVEVYEDELLVRGRDFIKGEWIEELEYRYPIG